MTAPRRITLPPLEAIDQGVRHLVATHGYVDTTGQPVYVSGEFPATPEDDR